VHFRPEHRSRTITWAAVALAAVLAQGALAADTTPDRRVSDAQIDAAVSTLKDDPNLFSKRTFRTLHWVHQSSSAQVPATAGWLRWIDDLFGWLTQTARILVWAICVVLVGILAVLLLRMLRQRREERLGPGFVAPTHVRDLDIRPESLPEDVGAASLELWSKAEHRAALALLYRGCLSRLAHVHAIPIRDSSTEGECVLLAAGHLPPDPAGYVSQLVRTWQRAVYRGENPSTELVTSLCRGFGAALDPPPRNPAELAA
jgi:hypothetical protein